MRSVNPSTLPPRIAEALARVLDSAPNQFKEILGVEKSLATSLNELFEQESELAQVVLAKRIFADDPATLDTVGRVGGVTRERVRQVQVKTETHVREAFERNEQLSDTRAAIRAAIGPLVAFEDLLIAFPALSSRVESVGQPAWRVLDRLDDTYEIVGAWCVADTHAAFESEVAEHLAEIADVHGVVALDDIGFVPGAASRGQVGEVIARWLFDEGYVLIQGHVLTRTGSLGDRAAGILSVAKVPLSTEAIHVRLGIDRSVRSLRNALSVDPRMHRVDRDEWALAEWDMESYGTIRNLIAARLETAGGSLSMQELIDDICGKYSVAEASVVAYAIAPPFKSDRGIVSLAVTIQVVDGAPG